MKSRAVHLLEETLDDTRLAVRRCFAEADACTPDNDEYGHVRTRALQEAARLLTVCAELGQAIAKIEARFEQRITIDRTNRDTRTGGGRKRKSGPAAPDAATGGEGALS